MSMVSDEAEATSVSGR